MVLCNLPYRLRKIAGRVAKKCRRRRDRSLDAKLADIRNLLIYNHPISSVPPATGKLRLLQDGNTVLLALLRAMSGKRAAVLAGLRDAAGGGKAQGLYSVG